MTAPIGLLRMRRAVPADLDLVVRLLADAFHGGDLAGWLVPDAAERVSVYSDYFVLLAEHALTYGVVDVADDAGLAVWYDHTSTGPAAIIDYDARLADCVGPHVAQFVALDQAMHAHHPTGRPHHYLAFLAVRPHRQGQGIGSALLHRHHETLDPAQLPAYLEATGPRNQRLYQRHGYESLASYAITDGGPALWPMWRPPNTDLPSPRRPTS